ncbi:putative LOC107388297-like protein [Nothobranchius furzeri]|uniref:LOC107388297-like protein n=1 Tax=Nothobranchius furzeri TaxID=105023 RepID=A0A9D2XMG0_NOTFU|nr:putative LOC107388297-like protein [Nothobranchius furzeri]
MREACVFLRMLQDEDFQFFLQLLSKIMPHVDILYKKLQKDIDAVFIKHALQIFMSSVEAIRQSSQQQRQEATETTTRRRMALGEDEKQRLREKICDTILTHTRERFSFTKHLVSATLLQAEMFELHCHTFPTGVLNATAEAYPMVNKNKLKTELYLVYENPECRSCCGALALYHLLMSYNLQDTFSETVALMNILITTPMTTAEAERCFSTLKRIKTFLRNSMGQEHLNALALLSIERELVWSMPDFNEKVIDHFALTSIRGLDHSGLCRQKLELCIVFESAKESSVDHPEWE